MIQGEERLIERAIVNIVQNSIEHTGDGGTIIARIERTASSNTLHISDTGVGIAPSRLAHVFDRFYKGDSAQGTGLGLSIVKEIVKQHDGVISIESTEGKGTTIQMTFPKVSLVSLVSKST
jgi:signal transduction histidine kinase